MLNNLFVSFTNNKLELPQTDTGSKILRFDDSLFNQYSDLNLEVTGTSFAPKDIITNFLNFLSNNSTLKQSSYVTLPQSELTASTNDKNTSTSEYTVSASKDALSRAVYVAKLLMKKGGFTKELAAAIAGTMIDENKCRPESYMKAEAAGKGAASTRGSNMYGAGIGSWTGSTKKRVLRQAGYSEDTKIENLTMDLLIDLLIKDTLTGNKKYYDALRRCLSIEDASATSVLITGGVGKSKNWNTHPTQAEAKALSDWYGRSNDKRFGKSKHHWNLDVRRLNYSKQVLAQL